MVSKGSHDRRASSSSSPSTKRRTSTKKVVKPMGICSFCLGDEKKNAQGVPEDMIDCAECGNCGHPSCLKYSPKLVEKIQTIRWQCLDCKKCVICHIGDEALLFCDYCDTAIHPKCCDPPLHHIPKGDFACPTCRTDGTAKGSSRKKSLPKASPTRSSRSKPSSPVLTRPVAQLIDGMSNFFLPKKENSKANHHQRQQSVQKAMKFLRDKNSMATNLLSSKKKNQSLARSILASSKTARIRKKPVISTEEPQVKTVQKRKHEDSPVGQTKKRKRKESEEEVEEEESEEEEKPAVSKRKLNLDLSKYKTPPSFLHDSLPDTIAAHDVYLFLDARKNSTKFISDCSEKFQQINEPIEEDANNLRWPPYIGFGDELIKTWYSSSYPQEYARVPCLFICEFCLKYMKCEQVYERHRKKCPTFHPPANEIYHKNDLSVFEVDGNINRIYCQNLCLLAKLFLDHKTLYYDVEPFLFYVLTRNDSSGCHFLGYFSKEKHCPQKYNLSCIMVLPNCQRRGYGRFLIELSYLLSQKERQIGTPERPLSAHGAHTYEAYWKIKIIEQLLKYHQLKREKCILKDLMDRTGMAVDDILDTLQNLGVLTMKSNEKAVVWMDLMQLESVMRTEKIKHAHWVSLDAEFLRFTPVLKPILLITDGSAVDQQSKEIQVIFHKIESESLEHHGEGGDGANTTEVVRLIRRRKFGRKRRSYYVKYRVPNKTEPNSRQHEQEDEHSQEYSERPQESNEETEEEVKTQPTSPVNSPASQPKFKQLTLDSFLKKVPSKSTTPVVQEAVFEISSEEESVVEKQTEVKVEEPRFPRRTKRLSNTHVSKSETDLSKIANELPRESALQEPKSLTKQLSSDLSPRPVNSPLPFKKRAWASSNVQALIDPPSMTASKKVDQPIFSRETSLTTPSSLSDILNNPLMTSSSSINTDDETKIARIESQLKTTVEAIREVEAVDDQPPSLTSPTSMIVSQSNHYNYPTRSSLAKEQSITINNFNNSTTMNYNYAQTPYGYPYVPPPAMDIPSYYYPPAMPMNYMPYYPTTTPPMYPTAQQMCYPSNGVSPLPYPPGTATAPYGYSTAQPSSSSSSSSSGRRH